MSAIYIIMGVSGSGKSTIGALLAKELAIPFFDADDFHPAVNIAKMREGKPLNDKDRQPWLLSLRRMIRNNADEGAVLACSALKEAYRRTLDKDLNVNWVHLEGDFGLIQSRMQERAHFMPASLLQSQFDSLEPLKHGLTLNIEASEEELVKAIRAHYEAIVKSQLGIIGMGVMGRSLAINAVSKGIRTAVYNRDTEEEAHIIPALLAEHPDPKLSGFTDWESFFMQLEPTKILLLMIPAGKAVDQVLVVIEPYLNPGDCVIDGGNSHYKDSERRLHSLKERGIGFLGMGISGGEAGALKGPAMMAGGDQSTFEWASPLLEKLAATDPKGKPCFGYLGSGGAGHLVKTVHNGIEYAEMQLLAEVYSILQSTKLPREDYALFFEAWNLGELQSYLMGIMPIILNKKDGQDYLLEKVLDVAGSKGTGAWTGIAALEAGQDASIIQAALNARYHSSAGWFRPLAKETRKNPLQTHFDMEGLKSAYQAARILNHLQGLRLIKALSDAHNWQVDLAEVCRIWTNGCIIKSALIEKLQAVLNSDPSKLEPWCYKTFQKFKEELKYSVKTGADRDIPLPVFSAALQFGLGISKPTTSANVIQAQRDYFGAHTYKRKDADLDKNFHTDWNKP